jgi:hypothetical protein
MVLDKEHSRCRLPCWRGFRVMFPVILPDLGHDYLLPFLRAEFQTAS